MEQKLISFETAKLAKEKGFEYKTIHCYDTSNPPNNNGAVSINPEGKNWNDDEKDEDGELFSAPPQSLLQKWLREEKGISVDVFTSLKEKRKFEFGCDMMAYFNINDEWQTYNLNKFFVTYEEALESGLKKALILINHEQN